jgi:hypothetical protein
VWLRITMAEPRHKISARASVKNISPKKVGAAVPLLGSPSGSAYYAP